MNDAFKSCPGLIVSTHLVKRAEERLGAPKDIRITLNNLLDTAAAAMVQRIMIRSRPLVFLLVLTCKNGSTELVAAIMAKENKKGQVRRTVVRLHGRNFFVMDQGFNNEHARWIRQLGSVAALRQIVQ